MSSALLEPLEANTLPARTSDAKLMPMLPREEYDALPHIRSTAAKDLICERGPRVYYQNHIEKQLPPKKAEHFVLGDLLHQAALEGRMAWGVWPHKTSSGRAAPRTGEKLAEWQEENPGLVPVLESQAFQLDGMLTALARNKQAMAALIESPMRELAVCGTDPETGVAMKALLDALTVNSVITDVKTTRARNRREFEREIERLLYHFSGCWYIRTLRLVPQYTDFYFRFRWLVLTKEPPFLASLVDLQDDHRKDAEIKVEEALRTLCECIEREKKLPDDADPAEAWPDNDEAYTAVPTTYFPVDKEWD